MNKVLTAINNQLDKARDFRYFFLFGSFVLFLDFLSILKLDISLFQMEYKYFSTGIKFGEVLIFFTLYTFFLSFFVPTIRRLLTIVFLSLPYQVLSVFRNEQFNRVKVKDRYYDFQLKNYAIKNNNAVAYQHYQNLLATDLEDEQLYHYSLAFLIAVLMNTYAYTINESALISLTTTFFNENEGNLLHTLCSLVFFFFCWINFYISIIQGCGISVPPIKEQYMEDNGFK
jgi:hypothetical protein